MGYEVEADGSLVIKGDHGEVLRMSAGKLEITAPGKITRSASPDRLPSPQSEK